MTYDIFVGAIWITGRSDVEVIHEVNELLVPLLLNLHVLCLAALHVILLLIEYILGIVHILKQLLSDVVIINISEFLIISSHFGLIVLLRLLLIVNDRRLLRELIVLALLELILHLGNFFNMTVLQLGGLL